MSLDPGSETAATDSSAGRSLYGVDFWLAYLANVLLVTGNALTFRFAEFIAYLGGSETLAGEIFGAGMIAALVARIWLGQSIDRFGPRLIWLVANVLFLAGAILLPMGGELASPGRVATLVWVARILYQMGVAGMFACSMVHIQNLAPPWRRTEIIGSLGTSGFVGQILGTQLGDAIFRHTPADESRFYVLFWTVAACGVANLFVVLRLTRREMHEPAAETPGVHRLLTRYWPGPVTLVAMAMGVNLAVSTVFLTRYATALNLSGIGVFFSAFSITAFACRWGFRSWAGRYGRHSMILWGLSGLALGQLLLLFVRTQIGFLLPAASCGFGHALLFPAVISLGSGKFPVQYRGTGTTLILGFMDLGMIIGAPVLGRIIDQGHKTWGSAQAGFDGMFYTASGFVMTTILVYALTGARQPDTDYPAPGVG
jgi:MFS family permease